MNRIKTDASKDWNEEVRNHPASKHCSLKKLMKAIRVKHSCEFSMLANPRHERFRGEITKCGGSNLDGDTKRLAAPLRD